MAEKIRIGLIMHPKRFILNQFTSATTPYLIRGIVQRFTCELITSQEDYDGLYDRVDALLSLEPQFASPVLSWKRGFLRRRKPKLSYVLCSDPHLLQWRERYFLENGISHMLALYLAPTEFHFREIPRERIVHFPWCVPDQFISSGTVVDHGQDSLCCFGGANSAAYELRNWCRGFPFVNARLNSGVENKQFTDEEYYLWLQGFDAAIAAGSEDPVYRLTTPKYFEIPAAGALLFAQETGDLDALGFRHRENCIVFTRDTFEELAREYLEHPDRYTGIRAKGRDLIRERHSLTARLDSLEKHIRTNLRHERE
jgi:hypothetical protein